LAEKLRVHTLSKELGVTSKAILEKCKLEGIEGVTNHMSTVSAGLAETIREWFSAQSQGTAVETAPPVDLEKVRAKRRPTRKRKKAAAATEAEGGETADAGTKEKREEAAPPAPAEPVATEVAAEAPAGAEGKATPETVAPAGGAVAVEEPPSQPTTVETPTQAPRKQAPAATTTAPTRIKPKPKPKPKPEPVRPAGPQNVPAPAQMRGPKVVGFAKPDVIDRPVPRSRMRAGPDLGDIPFETDHGPIRRRGKGRGALREEDVRSVKARSPRRSRSSMTEIGERLREWNDRDLLERQERLQEATGRGIHARRARERKAGPRPTVIAPRKTHATITEPVIVHELCAATGIGMSQLFPKLKHEHNMIIHRNSVIPTEIAQEVMLEFGIDLEVVKPKTELEKLKEKFDSLERKNLQPRPPVVTMLGHVDHGKTSLLDAIRKTSVAAGEAGGITQHIGAYRVERGDLSVTFLDTPGHEAFTAMRARGAHMTDVAVVVVAADDGVMPQTVEAINHAKAAGVTIVIALNKIDLPGVDINKVYGQLAEMELTPTEWGGDIDVIKTSAVTGAGVEELITHLATLSELLALKADPTLPARGAVIEAHMEQGVGPMARLLVQEGTLHRGDFLVCGPAWGRVRMMKDDRGRTIESAGPSMPVEVAGLDSVPNAGDLFYCVESLQQAKEVATEVAEQRRAEQMAQLRQPRTLDELFRQREAGEIPELNLILRADVQGSIDAILKMLNEIPSEDVKLNILHTGIGAVTESDVMLAAASNAMIVGFNVTADSVVQRMAETEGITMRFYRVIYELGNDIRKALEGLLPAEQTEELRGKAEVRETFRVSKVGVIAGCYVTEGVISRTNMVRVVRDGQIIVPTEEDVRKKRHRPIASLKRFKDDVREVRAGMECGLHVEGFDDVKPGDIIEAYDVVETSRTLA